jgi:hypothetical protein
VLFFTENPTQKLRLCLKIRNLPAVARRRILIRVTVPKRKAHLQDHAAPVTVATVLKKQNP